MPHLTSHNRWPLPGAGRDGLVPDDPAQPVDGFLTSRGPDVDALEEVAVGGEPLDPALGCRAGKGERGRHLGWLVRDAHDRDHGPEPRETFRVAVGHRHAMPEDAALDVDMDRALGLGLHGLDPPERLIVVELDAHPLGGFEDAGERRLDDGAGFHPPDR